MFHQGVLYEDEHTASFLLGTLNHARATQASGVPDW